LLISDEAEGPFCCQLHQAIIVLPRFLLEGKQEDLRHVLIHELEHLKTNHPVHLFIQHFAQVLCWFHPAVWSAAWQASITREYACDDAAASQGANCAAYLRTLLHIAERCEQKKNLAAIGFTKTPSEIILRAKRLLDLATHSPSYRGSKLRRTAVICILLTLTCSMTQLWVPFDPLSSSRSRWSPWPTWTAASLHCFGISVRDYEQFDRRVQVHELLLESGGQDTLVSEAPARNVAVE
jgi:beta-lactamase regulating signal transducer with metallopeptidase domain